MSRSGHNLSSKRTHFVHLADEPRPAGQARTSVPLFDVDLLGL